MIPAVEKKMDELERLCVRHGVQRLDLFGSASTDQYDSGESDQVLPCRVQAGGSPHLCGRLFRFTRDPGATLRKTGRFGGRLGHQESVFPPIGREDEDSRLCVLKPRNTCTIFSVEPSYPNASSRKG